MRTSSSQACEETQAPATQIRAVERELIVLARDRDDLKLLQTIPGIGVLTATALVALVGEIRFEPRVCELPGLTPKEDSSGTRRRLGAISKQGDIYVRMLRIHGARSILLRAHGAGQATALLIGLLAANAWRSHSPAVSRPSTASHE